MGARPRRSGLDRWAPAVLLVVGLAFAFGPTLGSRLEDVQTDLGDTRLNAYLLESHWRWLTGHAGHGAFDAPMAHPAASTLTLSDYMLSFVPFYAPFRAVGYEPRPSFQYWYLTMGALNYLLFLLLLRRELGFSRLASACGAFLFAFAAMRVQQLGHQQLLPQVWVVVGLWAAVRVFAGRRGTAGASGEEVGGPSAAGERAAIAVFCAAGVAQAYGAFYPAFFALVLSVLTAACALLLPASRRALLAFVRRRRVALAVAAVASLAAVAPLGLEYAATAEAVGGRGMDAVRRWQPWPASWLLVHPNAWLYGWTEWTPPFASVPEKHERSLGLGFVTTGVVLVLAWWRRDRTGVRLAAATWLAVVVLVTRLPGGLEPWRLVQELVPGAAGIRAVGRIGLWTLVPAAVALAAFVDATRDGPRRHLAAAVVAACLLEQGLTTAAYDEDLAEDWVDHVAARVDPEAEAFLVVGTDGYPPPVEVHLHAMWASLETGKPTLNCYSGNAPAGYPFWRNVIREPADRARLARGLRRWTRAHGLDPDAIQVIELTPDRR